MTTYEERVTLVHQWQRYYNMEPRSDSRLTEMFARGEVQMYPDQVARELLATDCIFKYTLYGELIEEFLRRVAAILKEQHGLSWSATWNIVRFYGPTALKLISVLQTQLVIPQCMPPSENDVEEGVEQDSSSPYCRLEDSSCQTEESSSSSSIRLLTKSSDPMQFV